MRVLLVQGLWRRKEQPVYPLGLAYLASSIRDRHEVRCFDESLPADDSRSSMEEALAWKPQVVGIGMRNCDGLGYQDIVLGDTGNALSPLQHVSDLADAIRGRLPGVTIVVGGAAFSIFARRVMEVAGSIDMGVLGEAEETFPRLLDSIDHPESVPGVLYRTGGRLEFTGPAELPDFGELPPPDRAIMDVRPYVRPDQPGSVGVQSKRGCGLNCSYCVYPQLNGPRVRIRRPSAVVDEIQDLAQNYGISAFQFADSVFNRPQEHAAEICREMLDRGLRVDWSAWFDLPSLDESFIRLAVRAGCRMFELSPDSYTDSILESLGKNLRRRDIDRVCRLAAGIPGTRIALNFIVGAPGETPATLARLLLFMLKLKLFHRGRIAVNALNPVRIMPGTPMHLRALAEGFVAPDTELLPLDPRSSQGIYYLTDGGSTTRFYRAFLRLGAWRRRLLPGREP